MNPPLLPHNTAPLMRLVLWGAGISAARLLAMEIDLATFALLHIAHHLQGSPPPCEGERHTKKLAAANFLTSLPDKNT